MLLTERKTFTHIFFIIFFKTSNDALTLLENLKLCSKIQHLGNFTKLIFWAKTEFSTSVIITDWSKKNEIRAQRAF